MIILILILGMVPLLLGMLYQNIIYKEQKNGVSAYVQGSLLLFFIAGLIALPVVKGRFPFLTYRNAATVVIGALCLISAVLFCVKKQWRRIDPDWKRVRSLLPAAGIFLCLAAVFFLYVPAAGDDCTAEVILTTVKTNSVFAVHPLTGTNLVQGMYPSAKLMTFPLVYSVLYDWSQTDITLFLYRIIPLWVLFVNFLMIGKWSGLLWKKQEDYGKRAAMLFFYGVLNLFGDYLFITYSYRLLHAAWMGETLLVVWILPYMAFLFMELLQDGKKNVPTLLLCFFSALFMAPWKMVVFLTVLLTVTFGILYGIRRRSNADSH